MKVKWEDDFPKECYSISASKTKYLTARKIKKFIRKVVEEQEKETKDQCATELEETIGAYRGVGGLLDKLINKWRGKK